MTRDDFRHHEIWSSSVSDKHPVNDLKVGAPGGARKDKKCSQTGHFYHKWHIVNNCVQIQHMRYVSNSFSLCFKSSAKSQGKGKSAAARRLWPFVRLALSHGHLITAPTFSLLFTNHVNSLCQENAGVDLCSMHSFFMNTSCQGDIIWFQNVCPSYIFLPPAIANLLY